MLMTLGLLPVVAILLGVPIFLALLLAVVVTLQTGQPMPMTLLHQTVFGSISSYTLLAIPFFLFTGELMGAGTMSRRIVDWVLSLVGRTPGAIGIVTVGTSGVYGAISGSSPATVASIGKQLYPEMVRHGYSRSFSLGLINAGGAISIAIPPSINLLLYAAVAEQSVVALFMAGILPGLLLLLALAVATLVYALHNGIREGKQFSLVRFAVATRHAFWALLMPVIVLGSIYGGFATPTEAGGFGCVYAILVTTCIHRELSLSDVVAIAGRSAVLTAQIMIIVAAAGCMSWLLAASGFQNAMTTALLGLDLPTWGLMLCINVLLLLVGCVIDPTSAILMFTPLLLPVAVGAGIDPIHFGIITTVNLSIGMFTPPFGLNLFVTQATMNSNTMEIYKGVLPFALLQVITLLVIIYVPEISLELL